MTFTAQHSRFVVLISLCCVLLAAGVIVGMNCNCHNRPTATAKPWRSAQQFSLPGQGAHKPADQLVAAAASQSIGAIQLEEGSELSCDDVFEMSVVEKHCGQSLNITNTACNKTLKEYDVYNFHCIKWLASTVGCRRNSDSMCRHTSVFHLIHESVAGDSTTGLAIGIISILASQRCPVVMLWVGRQHVPGVIPAFQQTEPAVRGIIKDALDLSVLQIKQIPASGRFDDPAIPASYNCTAENEGGDRRFWSDCVRLQILRLYGGFYMDSDALLLRDMWPLMRHDFMTPFGHQCPVKAVNNAIMYYRPQSVFLKTMLATRTHEPGKMLSTCLKDAACRHSTMIVLPAAFFDAYWQDTGDFAWKNANTEMDTASVLAACPECKSASDAALVQCITCPFFKGECPHNCSYKDFLPGAFGLHYHHTGKPWDFPARSKTSVANQLVLEMLPRAEKFLNSLREVPQRPV